MAEQSIKFKSKTTGNYLFPKTKGENVTNASGKTLENVEAGAQVNKIEVVKINGTAAEINNKTVNLTLQTYKMVEQETPETGFASSYYLADKDGVQCGAKINLAKDLFLKSAEIKTCTTANQPITGLAVGDKYIDFTLANATNQHIYLAVADLLTEYTAGTGIIITNNAISIDLAELKKTFPTKATTLAGYGITDAYAKTETYSKTEVDNLITAVDADLTYEVL